MAGPIEGSANDHTHALPTALAPSGRSPKPADLALGLLSLLALSSLCYAIATAPWMGKDLLYYQAIGRSWASGIYLSDSGAFYGPAPWTAVAFSVISELRPSQAVILMVAANLAAAAMTMWLAVAVWGRDWSIREKLFLCSLLLVWAPFRVTLRNGQLSLIVTALLLGFIWESRHKREYAAGALLGLSLIKYPLSFAFVLYTLWKGQWKTARLALAIPIALTLVYAARLEISPIRIALDYARDIAGTLVNKDSIFGGTTEIKPLLDYVLGSNRWLATPATLAVWLAALVPLGIAFSRSKAWEDAQLAALCLLTLCLVYHRTYDSVLLIIPAAVLISLRRRLGARRFAVSGLALLGLLALSVPGVLADRLKLDVAAVARNPLGFIGLHLERLIVLALFCSTLVLMMKLPALYKHMGPTDPGKGNKASGVLQTYGSYGPREG